MKLTEIEYTIPVTAIYSKTPVVVKALCNADSPFILQRGFVQKYGAEPFTPMKTWAGNGHTILYRATGQVVARNVPKRGFGAIVAALRATGIDWNAAPDVMKDQFNGLGSKLRSWMFRMNRGY